MTQYNDRDRSTFRLLGIFFSALGGLVLVGCAWTLDQQRALLVNAVSGLALTGIGAILLVVSQRMRRSQENTPSTRPNE